MSVDLTDDKIDKWVDGCLPVNRHDTFINLLQVVVPCWVPSAFLLTVMTFINLLQVDVPCWVPSAFLFNFMTQSSTCCRLLCHVECPVISCLPSWHIHQQVAGCCAMLSAQCLPVYIHDTFINLLQVVVPCWVPSADACSVVSSSHCSSRGRKQQQPLPPLRQQLHQRHMNIAKHISRTIRRSSKNTWTTTPRKRTPIRRVSVLIIQSCIPR
jgi:hypothetical protein